jgi:translin
VLVEIVRRMVEELVEKEKVREEALQKARRARILSKQSILLIHEGDLKQADMMIMEARRLLAEAKNQIRDHGISPFEEVYEAEEEHAEASVLYGLKTSGLFPNPEEVGVSLESYILGVGDVVGELRREALDCLRLGMVERAEEDLKLMERIYLDLLTLEEASLLLKGLRRKLDVARGVIEATRGEVTSELARARLSASIQRLIEKLEKLEIR